MGNVEKTIRIISETLGQDYKQSELEIAVASKRYWILLFYPLNKLKKDSEAHEQDYQKLAIIYMTLWSFDICFFLLKLSINCDVLYAYT